MYLTILVLPLLGSIISGLMGRKVGVTGSHIITITCLVLASVLASFAFYEVGISGSPVSIRLSSWIDSENLSVSWEFLFDSLTVSMFIPVLYISTLIHLFSVNYMGEDPAKCSGTTFFGCKLSNSGEPLKLLVPSYSRKAISGWINYPCMVTSQEIDEKKMGNRGSKSDFNPDFYSILTIITFYALLCFWLSESTDQNSCSFFTTLSPIVAYIDADQEKLNIIKENAAKSGVYRWVNKDNEKCYIGSSIHLSRRFSCYYSIKFLIKKQKYY
jgi:hypothetical protein